MNIFGYDVQQIGSTNYFTSDDRVTSTDDKVTAYINNDQKLIVSATGTEVKGNLVVTGDTSFEGGFTADDGKQLIKDNLNTAGESLEIGTADAYDVKIQRNSADGITIGASDVKMHKTLINALSKQYLVDDCNTLGKIMGIGTLDDYNVKLKRNNLDYILLEPNIVKMNKTLVTADSKQYLIDGGNTAGEILEIGTTDDFDTKIKRNNTDYITCDTNGITMNQPLTLTTNITTDQIDVDTYGTNLFLTDYMKLQSASIIGGCEVTPNGTNPLNVDISAGTICFKNTSSPDDTAKFYTFGGATDFKLISDSSNWLYLEWKGDSVQLSSTASLDDVNMTNQVIVGSVYHDGTSLFICNRHQHFTNLLSDGFRKSYELEQQTRLNGLIVDETGNRYLQMSAGSSWISYCKKTYVLVNTSASDRFRYWYSNGSGGFATSSGIQQISNIYYDNGSGITALTTGRYGTHYVFVNTNNSLEVLYGTGNYLLSEALSAGLPSAIPTFLSGFCLFIAKIVILKNSDNFYLIQYPFSENITYTQVGDHLNLLNIGTNSHSDIDNFIASKGQVSGLCPLDGSGVIDNGYLPSISHTTLTDIGTNSHSQIDTFISSKGQVSGLCPLDGSGVVDNGYLPSISHTTLTDIGTNSHSQIDTFIASKAQVSGLCPLDGSGLIPTAYLPSLSITSVYTVADNTERDALTVQEGDTAVVTSTNKCYMYNSSSTWIEISSNGIQSITVNGEARSTSNVTIDSTDFQVANTYKTQWTMDSFTSIENSYSNRQFVCKYTGAEMILNVRVLAASSTSGISSLYTIIILNEKIYVHSVDGIEYGYNLANDAIEFSIDSDYDGYRTHQLYMRGYDIRPGGTETTTFKVNCIAFLSNPGAISLTESPTATNFTVLSRDCLQFISYNNGSSDKRALIVDRSDVKTDTSLPSIITNSLECKSFTIDNGTYSRVVYPSVERANMYNISNTTTNTMDSTWQKLNTVTSSNYTTSTFTHTSNKLTYTGGFTRKCNITADIVMHSSTQYYIYMSIYKNGTQIPNTEMVCAPIQTTSSSGIWLYNYHINISYSLVANDYFEVYAYSLGGHDIYWLRGNVSISVLD